MGEHDMSEFLGLLKSFKDGNTVFVVAIEGKKVRVKVTDSTGDMITLREEGGSARYDLHYTHVIICSQV
jgi:hypothetical protein